jgi:hypothetical protein
MSRCVRGRLCLCGGLFVVRERLPPPPFPTTVSNPPPHPIPSHPTTTPPTHQQTHLGGPLAAAAAGLPLPPPVLGAAAATTGAGVGVLVSPACCLNSGRHVCCSLLTFLRPEVMDSPAQHVGGWVGVYWGREGGLLRWWVGWGVGMRWCVSMDGRRKKEGERVRVCVRAWIHTYMYTHTYRDMRSATTTATTTIFILGSPPPPPPPKKKKHPPPPG